MAKPRKKYRPKPVDQQAYLHGLLWGRFLSTADQVKNATTLAVAIANISKHGGGKQDWLDVFDVVNMFKVMTEEGSVMTGADEFVESCYELCYTVMTRRKESGSTELMPDEASLLDEMRSLWAQVLGAMTYGDFQRIKQKVSVRVAHALVHSTRAVDVAEVA